MHLVYLDESGNSGNNLNDPAQPVFVLCAMIVPEQKWIGLERDLSAAMDEYFSAPRPDNFEIHGTEVRTGKGFCKGMPVSARIAFRDAWMRVAADHGVKLIYRAIEKKRYQRWQQGTFGAGVRINPHVAAFALVARVVDAYLGSLPGAPLGLFISDENKEVMADVEKSIRALRVADGALKLCQVVEKGFFINSVQSLPLQLCDLFALSLRKHEERSLAMPSRSIDESGIERALALVHRGNEAFQNVIAWLAQRQNGRKEEATGG